MEFEDEIESEEDREIESASENEAVDDEEDVADDVSETCAEKDDEPLANENVAGIEKNGEKQQGLVTFFSSIFFQLSRTACYSNSYMFVLGRDLLFKAHSSLFASRNR